MAAPDNTVRKFKASDLDHGASSALHNDRVVRHDFDDRRRMSVSERLAEGRGFWRGAFVGASIGVAGGIVASGGIASMWTDQVLKTVQNSVLIGGTLGDRSSSASGDLVHQVHPDSTQAQTTAGATPAGPAGSAAR